MEMAEARAYTVLSLDATTGTETSAVPHIRDLGVGISETITIRLARP